MFGSLSHANASLRNNEKLRRGSGSYFRREVSAPPRPVPVRPTATITATRRRELRRELRRERRRRQLLLVGSLLVGSLVSLTFLLPMILGFYGYEFGW